MDFHRAVLVLFWSLDRFSREGIRKTILYLQQLDGFGVKFKSYSETPLDTDNELVSHILLGVLSYFADLEAKKISERMKAGLVSLPHHPSRNYVGGVLCPAGDSDQRVRDL